MRMRLQVRELIIKDYFYIDSFTNLTPGQAGLAGHTHSVPHVTFLLHSWVTAPFVLGLRMYSMQSMYEEDTEIRNNK